MLNIRALLTAFALLPAALAQESESRDPWHWFFATDSIWNMPVGSAARYAPANLKPPRSIGCDVEWHIRVNAGDPVVPVLSPSSWTKRWPGNRHLGELRVPDSLVIPDANPPHTPNACAAFLMPDGRTIRQLEPTCRVSTGAHIVGWLHPDDQDLFGPGIKGTHYGSGLSAIGGSIRIGELTTNTPLRHALKLNIWGEHLFYPPGFRWPADRCDANAPNSYHGKNPKLVMGTLLAIPADITPEKLAVTGAVGRKIFHALQDYGAYVVDDAGWDACDLCVERGVMEEVKQRFGYALTGDTGTFANEMKRIIPALVIIENNAAGNEGGGGKPRRPLAPSF